MSVLRFFRLSRPCVGGFNEATHEFKIHTDNKEVSFIVNEATVKELEDEKRLTWYEAKQKVRVRRKKNDDDEEEEEVANDVSELRTVAGR